jgi:hypothetical protein
LHWIDETSFTLADRDNHEIGQQVRSISTGTLANSGTVPAPFTLTESS